MGINLDGFGVDNPDDIGSDFSADDGIPDTDPIEEEKMEGRPVNQNGRVGSDFALESTPISGHVNVNPSRTNTNSRPGNVNNQPGILRLLVSILIMITFNTLEAISKLPLQG